MVIDRAHRIGKSRRGWVVSKANEPRPFTFITDGDTMCQEKSARWHFLFGLPPFGCQTGQMTTECSIWGSQTGPSHYRCVYRTSSALSETWKTSRVNQPSDMQAISQQRRHEVPGQRQRQWVAPTPQRHIKDKSYPNINNITVAVTEVLTLLQNINVNKAAAQVHRLSK